ncbi:DUF2218 domain-containing protein [Rhodobacterales bacterium HKCCE2091]|nr:DUF2218 domain-containing protein [Rhodobacterales bacterium HKCCE2091]
MQSTAQITTAKASGYLQQLAKHFAHKRPVTFDPSDADIRFDGFRAELHAEGEVLSMAIHADDAELLSRGEDVIWRHLERFAFREELVAPDWQRAA